ncbi:HDOD domain-containing protein [Stygiobacter electus]|uniref:HDOD domain-containing protein n=1 Tax=Stygiobacter electus TaxID=3032292 RepID=A0AAE3TBH6_9BACT|nr:HDOD domain-containing protein [Stygiobacter electus]MDF1611293.1 HDOD domain-containing protein [Stygiobacter electus]
MNISEKLINSINNLPTLPTLYNVITEAIEDPYSTNTKLANIILTDQSTTMKVLKVANSPLYGFHGKIDSISDAILYIGRNEIKNIVLTLSIISSFSKRINLKGFRPIDLWAHSIAVGVISRNIAQALGEKKLENYFLAGILHDIGKIIFLEYAVEEYKKVFELAKKKEIIINDAEKQILGINHEEIGQLLAKKWRIPETIQNVILYHSKGSILKTPDFLVSIVHLSNIIAHILELGYSGYDIIQQPSPIIWDTLKIKKGMITSLKDKIINDYTNTVKLIIL